MTTDGANPSTAAERLNPLLAADAIGHHCARLQVNFRMRSAHQIAALHYVAITISARISWSGLKACGSKRRYLRLYLESKTFALNSFPEIFGKYPVIGRAGTGNMGNVFVGFDPFANCALRARSGCVILIMIDTKLAQASEQTRARCQRDMLCALTLRLSLSGVSATGAESDRAH